MTSDTHRTLAGPNSLRSFGRHEVLAEDLVALAAANERSELAADIPRASGLNQHTIP